MIVGLYRDCAGLAGVSRIGEIHRRKPVCKVSQHVYRRCADKLRALAQVTDRVVAGFPPPQPQSDSTRISQGRRISSPPPGVTFRQGCFPEPNTWRGSHHRQKAPHPCRLSPHSSLECRACHILYRCLGRSFPIVPIGDIEGHEFGSSVGARDFRHDFARPTSSSMLAMPLWRPPSQIGGQSRLPFLRPHRSRSPPFLPGA